MSVSHLSRQCLFKSIECIKSVISKLDSDKLEEFNGVETVLSQFSPNDIISDPLSVLDSLVLYLYCVHSIDWNSDSWKVTNKELIVREEEGVIVTGSGGRQQEEQTFMRRLEHRTELFLQV